jgi:hypothetical protein
MDTIHEQLEEIYSLFRPLPKGTVEKLLLKHAGREKELLVSVAKMLVKTRLGEVAFVKSRESDGSLVLKTAGQKTRKFMCDRDEVSPTIIQPASVVKQGPISQQLQLGFNLTEANNVDLSVITTLAQMSKYIPTDHSWEQQRQQHTAAMNMLRHLEKLPLTTQFSSHILHNALVNAVKTGNYGLVLLLFQAGAQVDARLVCNSNGPQAKLSQPLLEELSAMRNPLLVSQDVASLLNRVAAKCTGGRSVAWVKQWETHFAEIGFAGLAVALRRSLTLEPSDADSINALLGQAYSEPPPQL